MAVTMTNTRKNSISKKPQLPKAGSIKIIGTGKYPLVPTNQITIVERPTGDNPSQLFFNPRQLSSFTPDIMSALELSIRSEGLIEPPLVRAITAEDGVTILAVQLIAGERRLRSVLKIIAEDLPCLDENAERPKTFKENSVVTRAGKFGVVLSQVDGVVNVRLDQGEKAEWPYDDTSPTISGKKLYEHLPCNMLYNCSDERALRLAFTENDKSEPLTVAEEVTLVERLTMLGKKQDEICEILGANVTWVSQTSNFREELPKAAFDKLVAGKMARHVAVAILSYPPEDRQKIFEASQLVEIEQTKAKVRELRQEQFQHEDAQELAIDEAKKAAKAGDTAKAQRETRRAASAGAKAAKAKQRRQRVEADAGVIKQGHTKQASIDTGITPKKGKMLDRQQIEEYWVDGLTKYVTGDELDPETGNVVPMHLAAIARRTASAILKGCADPLSVIREYLIANEQGDDDADLPVGKSKKGHRPLSDLDEDLADAEAMDDDDEPRGKRDRRNRDEEDFHEDFARYADMDG